MEVFQGRPADVTGRLEKEIAVYDLLDQLDIPFRRVDHDHADTMEMCQEIDQALGQDICKNLFLCNRQKTKYYLTPGSVTVLGLMYDPDCQVTLLIDQDLYQQTAFGCHPCINTSTVQFSTADLREKLLPALGHPVTLVQL